MSVRSSNGVKNKTAILLVAVCLLVSVGIGSALYAVYNRKVERTVSAVAQSKTTQEETFIELDGVSYRPDSSVKAYLFLGVDDAGRNYEDYGRGGRTDTLLLLVKREDTLRILEISRDTMTEVDTYDASGDYLSTGVMQINMQYSYGDSPRRSAYLTKRTVSALLGGVRIDGAIALDMSGIAPIVDTLGGITVKMEEDCSYIDTSYTKDAVITMDGAKAERFIRWRDTSQTGSNDRRMGRHSWFIRQMLGQMEETELTELLKAAEPYLNTDMTAEELQALKSCSLTESIKVPGETRAGKRHEEFYVDEDALREIVVREFYVAD